MGGRQQSAEAARLGGREAPRGLVASAARPLPAAASRGAARPSPPPPPPAPALPATATAPLKLSSCAPVRARPEPPTAGPTPLRARRCPGGRGDGAVPPPGPALPGPAEAVGGSCGRGINRGPSRRSLCPCWTAGRRAALPREPGGGCGGSSAEGLRLVAAGRGAAGHGRAASASRLPRPRSHGSGSSRFRRAPPIVCPRAEGCAARPPPALAFVCSGRRRGGAAPAVMRAAGRQGVRSSR